MAPKFSDSCVSLRAPDDEARDGGTLKEPIERDLRHGFPDLHHPMGWQLETLVINGRFTPAPKNSALPRTSREFLLSDQCREF
jgi:hypothetical protein